MKPPFKAYDLRGRVPEELNNQLCYHLGRAFCHRFAPQTVVIGQDVRPTSKELATSLAAGLKDGGAEVLDLGLCATEEVYFATFAHQLGGGLMVTASHNPAEYNGVKLIGPGAQALDSDNDLPALAQLVEEQSYNTPHQPGHYRPWQCRSEYLDLLCGQVNTATWPRYKVVVNAGNGCAGPIVEALESCLPLELVKLHTEPDGSFPHGIPNPLLPEKRQVTAEAVQAHGADLGIAWDGDADRCFIFDENGAFVEGYYIIGLLAAALLADHPGATIIHEPRLTWNTREIVLNQGGIPWQSRTGHAFIKAVMRQQQALYGGEMSGHHYFRQFGYCDSGMLPWLLVMEQMARQQQPLSTLVAQQQAAYPISGEINRQVADTEALLAAIRSHYAPTAKTEDTTDGLSLEFDCWRFNLRRSNTEPLVRLNVETRADARLLQQKTQELLEMIDAFA